MLSPAGRRASGMLALPFAAGIYVFSECGAFAQSADDLPPAAEPLLGEEGDWSADFNEAQIACYQGSMNACDSIWLDDRSLDSPPGSVRANVRWSRGSPRDQPCKPRPGSLPGHE